MTVGRVAGDVRHLRHGDGTRGDRASILHESMRDLDPDAAEIHARINPNIVLADTHLNVAMVNDGDGGFRAPSSTHEVLDYGDARIGNVHRKMLPRSFETTLIVVHLPKTLCEEVPDFYPVMDGATGDPALDVDGSPRMRSRWVARNRAEALRFFDAVLDYYSTQVLNGGQAAVHGYDINFDESTPHIQIMADTLAPDPKHDGKLRVEGSQMWGAHRDVTVDKIDRSTGEVVVDAKTGDPVQVMEQGPAKMSRYQQGLREHMYGLGYDVELDYDPERHLSAMGKVEYAETRDAENAVFQRGVRVRTREVNVSAAEKELSLRTRSLEDAEAALPRARRKAVEEGKAEGLAGAQSQIKAQVDEQVEQTLQPAYADLLRRQKQLAAEREQIEEEVREMKRRCMRVLREADAAESRAEVAREKHAAAADQYRNLVARLQPAVRHWERRDPATEAGKVGQLQLSRLHEVERTAATIETETPSDEPEFGG